MQRVLKWAPILKENGQKLKEQTVCDLLHGNLKRSLGWKEISFLIRVEAKTAIHTSN